MRYRIVAYGTNEHPDLNYEADIVPHDLAWKYPMVSVSLLTPISREAIEATIDDGVSLTSMETPPEVFEAFERMLKRQYE